MRREKTKKAFKGSKFFLGIHLVIVVAPLMLIGIWAFTNYWPWPQLLPSEYSLRAMEEVFREHNETFSVLIQSILIAIATAVVTVVVATMAARALTQHSFRGKELFRFATILPFLIPVTVFAMGIQVAFIQMGLANTISGVIIAHSIVALPYAVTIMTDVSAALGKKLEEQAEVLGASKAQVLKSVSFPLLLPGIISAASMSYILSFSQYFLTLLIGGGTVKTFSTVMFPFLASGDRSIASAYTIIFLISTIVVFLFFELLLRRYRGRNVQVFYE